MVYMENERSLIDQDTENPLVKVNPIVCKQLADFLRDQDIPLDKERISLHHLSQAEFGNFYFLLVSICHQTSPVNKEPLWGMFKGSYKKGWDYLSASFEEAISYNKHLLQPHYWQLMTLENFEQIFALSKVQGKLPECQRRVHLINDLGGKMLSKGWQGLDDIYDFCGGRVSIGEPNLLSILRFFEAYRDPVNKKALYLLSIMNNSGFWIYKDPENLGPPVDYHEVRGHLRIGTVSVLDRVLKNKLLKRIKVTPEEDIAIRKAVYNSIILLSDLTGLTPARLHYLFWNVFRSCCTREKPHCFQLRLDCVLPDNYLHLARQADKSYRCPFSNICSSARQSAIFYEHFFETEHY